MGRGGQVSGERQGRVFGSARAPSGLAAVISSQEFSSKAGNLGFSVEPPNLSMSTRNSNSVGQPGATRLYPQVTINIPPVTGKREEGH